MGFLPPLNLRTGMTADSFAGIMVEIWSLSRV